MSTSSDASPERETDALLSSVVSPDTTEAASALIIDEGSSQSDPQLAAPEEGLKTEVVSSTSVPWNLDHVEQLDTSINIEV